MAPSPCDYIFLDSTDIALLLSWYGCCRMLSPSIFISSRSSHHASWGLLRRPPFQWYCPEPHGVVSQPPHQWDSATSRDKDPSQRPSEEPGLLPRGQSSLLCQNKGALFPTSTGCQNRGSGSLHMSEDFRGETFPGKRSGEKKAQLSLRPVDQNVKSLLKVC